MSDYVRLTCGLADKGELLPATQDITPIIRKQSRKDFYRSLFKYTEEHLKQFKETGTIKGITGLKTNQLLWDFDSNDIRRAQKDATELVARLVEFGVPEDNVQIYFSGNKGFGIEVQINEDITRQEFINIQFGLANDLETFDKRIHNDSRVIRVPLTRHQESGLYKIPLTPSELISLTGDEIKEMAINPFKFKIKAAEPVSLPDELQTLKETLFIQKNIETKEFNSTLTFDIADIDFGQCPPWLDKERFALQQGFFYGSESTDVGERNTAFLILAATYKKQGFSSEHALGLLMATSEIQSKRTGESPYTEDQMRREILNTVYNAGWRGGTFSKDDPLLVLTRKRFNLMDDTTLEESDAVSITEVGSEFKTFAQNIKNNRIFTGLKSLDTDLVLTTGMLCTVVSAPGGGKTAISNMLAETCSLRNEDVLYFSLDLYKNLLFSRMLQRHVRYDFQEILNQFESGTIDDQLLQAYSDVINSYSKVSFIFKSSTIDSIEQEVKNYTERKGSAPKLIIVDYLDKVKTHVTDLTQSSSIVASRLSDIAKKYQSLVLLLAQPSKFGSSGPNQEFKSYRSLKGSSTIESDSRVILGIHRPGYDPTDQSRDLYSTITILKNNTGPLMSLDYAWDGLAGTFSELTIDQKRSLYKLRKELEEKSQSNGFDI